jgi:serine protease Do
LPSPPKSPLPSSKSSHGQAIERGYLGVRIQPCQRRSRRLAGPAKNRGEFIQSVEPGAGAAKAGIQAGDVVTRVDGKDVTPDQTLSFLVANTPPGKKITIDLLRNGKPMTVNAVVGKRPTDEDLANQSFDPDQQDDGGFGQGDGEQQQQQKQSQAGRPDPEVAGPSRRAAHPDHCPPARCQRGRARLVVSNVDSSSDAGAKGLQRRDILLSANYRMLAPSPIWKPWCARPRRRTAKPCCCACSAVASRDLPADPPALIACGH